MREIKFRGKAKHTNKWLCGDLIKIGDSYHILGKDDMIEDGHHIKQYSDIPTWIDEKTVGQFTGLLDKNDKEIFEGDIISILDEDWEVIGSGKVEWLEEWGVWYVDGDGESNDGLFDLNYNHCLEVIGNVYDDFNLL